MCRLVSRWPAPPKIAERRGRAQKERYCKREILLLICWLFTYVYIGLLLTYLSLSTGEYFYNRIGWGWLLVADRNNSTNLECQLSTATATLNEIFEVWGPGDCSFIFCHLHPFCCLCHLCFYFWCCPCCANKDTNSFFAAVTILGKNRIVP